MNIDKNGITIKIAANIEPISHVPPYKRIDPSNLGRKSVITAIEVFQGGGREPDAAIYRFSSLNECWYLKDGI